MPPDRDRDSLEDMLSYAREATEAVRDRRPRDLETDRFFSLALQRLVEVIGEAAARVSSQTREWYPQVPWRRMIGMRNRLIHGYDLVDPEVLWSTLIQDLPALIDILERVLDEPL